MDDSEDNSASLLDCLFEIDEFLEDSQLSIDDHDTSLTPREREEKELPSFRCYERKSTDEQRELLETGFIKAGVLERLLHNEHSCVDAFDQSVVSLCGHMTVTCAAVMDDLDVHFFRFRRQLNNVLRHVTNPSTTDDFVPFLSNCFSFLQFIDNHTSKLTSSTDDKPHPLIISIIDNILLHLTNVLASLQPINELLTRCREGFPPGLHLLLHLFWCHVSVSYRAVGHTSRSDEGAGSRLSDLMESCDQIVRLLLKQSRERFDRDSFQHLSTSSFFHCPCVKEVWLLVATVTDQLSTVFNTQNFWSLVSRVIGESTSLTFDWWTLTQLTRLLQYSFVGVACDNQINGDWKTAQELITTTIKEVGVVFGEAELRWCWKCVLFLYSTWATPTLTPIVLLWGFNHKHFNNSFDSTQFRVKSTLSLDTLSSVEWFEYINTTVCSDTAMTNISVQDGRTSFEIFLQIVHAGLSGSHGNQVWRQLKSRIYSKFSQQRVQDLSQHGLRHLVTLFLSLVHVLVSEEPALQLLSFLNYIKLSNDSRSTAVWKGILTLLLVCNERGVALPEIEITRINSKMMEAATPRPSSNLDNAVSMETVSTILDSLHYLFDMKVGVASWTLPLYGILIKNVYSADATISMALSFVSKMLKSLSCKLSMSHDHERCHNDSTKQLKMFAKSFYQQVCPPIVKLADSAHYNCTPNELSSTLKDITVFTCTWISTDDGHRIFIKVGVADSPALEVVLMYLNHLLINISECDSLLHSINTPYHICHSWLRGLLILGSCHQLVLKLKDLLVRLDRVQEIIGNQVTTEPIGLFLALIKGVANKHSTSVNIQEKLAWKERLLLILSDNYCSYYDAVSTSNNHLRLYYRVSAALVRHCAALMYSKSSTKCPLPRLLDTLVLPVISTRRPAHAGLGTLIKTHLHHFLNGLFSLNPDKDDFIARKIKQIFSRYFRSYAEPPNPLMAGRATQPNPFMTLLSPALVDTPTTEASNMLTTCVSVIVNQELISHQRPSLIVPCLLFLNSLFSKITSTDLLLRCVPIATEKLLSCLLLSNRSQEDSSALQKEAGLCLGTLLSACNKNRDKCPLTHLEGFIREYVYKYININTHKCDVFKPLVSVVTHYPALSSNLLDMLQAIVIECELKRGSGVDTVLRSALEDFKNSV